MVSQCKVRGQEEVVVGEVRVGVEERVGLVVFL